MKICIYQAAFILAIFSISQSLYCKRNDHSVQPEKDLVTAVNGIKDSMNTLIKNAQEVTKLHNKTSALDPQDKSLSGTHRSRIKRAQSFSSTALAQKDREIHKTMHYLKKTQEQIDSAANLMANSSQLTHDAVSNIPVE